MRRKDSPAHCGIYRPSMLSALRSKMDQRRKEAFSELEEEEFEKQQALANQTQYCPGTVPEIIVEENVDDNPAVTNQSKAITVEKNDRKVDDPATMQFSNTQTWQSTTLTYTPCKHIFHEFFA
ncbi:unnamed protein product [Gongylonema pulchrum]|uniref:UPF0561 protein C2orf68 homolog n=1 Tax=Gongylonema pulchrum TaxID=637853 RepID=A0A183CX30_9BILA|nr:unnamed protein product [Gongylonema pulchrum]